jgi:hypothetical protein
MQIPLDVPNLGGGISSAPVEPTELLDAIDVMYAKDGSVYARGGLDDFAGGYEGIPIGFFNANFSKYGSQLLMQTTTGVYKFTAPNTWTILATGIGSTVTGGSMCQLDQMVYVASPDYTALTRYNGAGFAHCNGSPGDVSLVCCDQNYVYAANGNEIWYAESGADFSDLKKFRTTNGQAVVDFCHLYGSLIIFTKQGIDIKRGLYEEDFTIEPINNTGCYSRICPTPQGIYFMGITTLMRFDGSNSKVASTKLNSDVFSNNSGDIVIMFYSSEYQHLYIPCKKDSHLWCYDILSDRWSRFNVGYVYAIGNTGAFAASGTKNAFWITYSGAGTAMLYADGGSLSAEIGGVPDVNFTKGGEAGKIDLSEASVATLGGLKAFIDGLDDYECDYLTPYLASTPSIGFTPITGVVLGTTRTYLTFTGGVTTPVILIGDNLGTVKSGWNEYGVAGGYIKSAIFNFGSKELKKRPKYLMVNGNVASIQIYSNIGIINPPLNYREAFSATLEKSIESVRQENILPFPGLPRKDFCLVFQGVTNIYSYKFIVEGVTWRGHV